MQLSPQRIGVLVLLLAVAVGGIFYFKNMGQQAENEMVQEESESMQNPLVGTFAAMLPAASGSGRIVTLETAMDGTATLTQDYQNDAEPIVESGTWVSEGENTLSVTLADQKPLQFVFDPMNAGVLTLSQADQATWGAEGLTLQNALPFIDQTWIWNGTLMSDGAQTSPDDARSFSLAFSDLGMVSATTDCNTGSGGFSLTGMNNIAVGPLATTMMFCEDSQEGVFFQQLSNVNSYFMRDGKLFLLLKFDSGSMEFVQSN